MGDSMKLNPNTKRFNAKDMLRFARYITDGKQDWVLKHNFECWFRGPKFDRKGIDWNWSKK